MHLGPEAMKMIGQGIAQDVAANRANSWFAREAESSYDDDDDDDETPILPNPRPGVQPM